MGACNSTTNNKPKNDIIIIDESLNFEWSPDESNKESNKNPIYKINAELYNLKYDNIKRKKTKILICKYLYIDQYGKIFSQIPRKESRDLIKLEGSIDRKGIIKLKKIEEKIECNHTTTYEGKLTKKHNILIIEGTALTSSNINDETDEKTDFSLEFSQNEWIVEYTIDKINHKINAYLELNENENYISSITGISFQEEKGISMWRGIEKENKNITLTQQYIEDSKIASDEHKKVFYQGTIDRISNVIVGVIQGKDMDGINFKITLKKGK